MKRFLILVLLFSFTQSTFASHLKGGWIQYQYIGPGIAPNTSQYRITVRQYLDCNSTSAQRDANVFVGIFDGATNQLLTTLNIPLEGSDNPNKTTYSPCISSPPKVCYFIDRYAANVELPNNPAGYTLTVQRCCRIIGIVNVNGNSSAIGISYTNRIPGTINGVDYSHNSSPVFAQKDTAIVCYNSPFSFDFSATDPDGDAITYSFCSGLIGGDNTTGGTGAGTGPQPNPPSDPPYTAVAYSTIFSGASPMGSTVTIDPQTGIISGIAPSITGDYIVAVCANEFRNGVLIGTTKKEIHIKVADCSISAAALKPTYTSCNGTTLTFQNESPNSTIISYFWDFGVASLKNDTSTQATPTFDYLKSGKDSGTYTVKLVVASSGGCKDSATARVNIFPGFKPGFKVVGTCYLNNYQFIDTTFTQYGVVNSWRWDLGDSTTLADTSRSQDTVWKYTSPVSSTKIKLVVTNNKGCIDSITQQLAVLDKPVIKLGFKDTLICSNDTLALSASIVSGTVVWTPSTGPNKTRILNNSSLTPLVFPHDTTRYYVTVNDNGCSNTDSLTVNVLQFISVDAGRDTGICLKDSYRLQTVSDALSYQWKSSTGEIIQNIKNPVVTPLSNTKYFVVANLGKCQANDSVVIKVSPYPVAVVGNDTTICFGNRIKLTGRVVGSVFYWSPTNSLINENSLTPIAGPSKTTMYILTASDTIGCPKPVSDTVLVTVVPPINAYAGKDTTILPNQSVQMNASGGTNYLWSPATGLSATDIPNPIVNLGNGIDSVNYTVTVSTSGCSATDQVFVRVYKNAPDILVPSAFTPNGDGKNDVARPIVIGITKLTYFTIFNRIGEPVFSTTEIGKGWDGIYKNIPQPSGTYVYETQGIDYLGQVVFRKGTIVLIR